MKNIMLLLILTLSPLSVTAKDNKKSCVSDSTTTSHMLFEPKLAGEIYYRKPILGKEFFNESYWKGEVELNNGQTATDKWLRYNGRIDELLLLPPNSGREVILDKHLIRGFRLKNKNNDSLVYFQKIRAKKELDTDTSDIFAQLLYQSKLSLYAFRRFIHSRNEDISLTGNYHVSKEIYEASPVYYFLLHSGRTISFKKFRKRDLYKLFPGNKEMMKKLFKEQHQRRFRSEEDLIKITGILNTIVW